jgi:hypothetical protein
MTNNPKNLLDALRARGTEVFGQVSADLMQNPRFAKALQGALRGKELLDQAAGRALKNMNIPTRTEFKRALGRIETLERELAEQKAKVAKAARRAAGKARKAR